MIALPSDTIGGVVDIQEIAVETGAYSFLIETNGAVLRRFGREVVAHPAHVVVIGRARDLATRAGDSAHLPR